MFKIRRSNSASADPGAGVGGVLGGITGVITGITGTVAGGTGDYDPFLSIAVTSKILKDRHRRRSLSSDYDKSKN